MKEWIIDFEEKLCRAGYILPEEEKKERKTMTAKELKTGDLFAIELHPNEIFYCVGRHYNNAIPCRVVITRRGQGDNWTVTWGMLQQKQIHESASVLLMEIRMNVL